MTFHHTYWQQRLEELCTIYHVPGASLSLLVDGNIHELASGILHKGTGVETTTASLFQIGSITKVYTATLIMQLIEAGKLELDTPVHQVLPEFTVPDADANYSITIRNLLCHMSGLIGDFFPDTGRGDDCLAQGIALLKDIELDFSPGKTVSYSSSGYNVLGRIIEVITGQSWDNALKEQLLTPLGLTSTVTLPEEVLRFRAAMGHLGEPGQEPEPAPYWNLLPRSAGPSGSVLCTTAADMIRMAKMHLDNGIATDGTRVLTPATVAAMRKMHVSSPDRWTCGNEGWGLGWMLYNWNGIPVFGHDGATIGQNAYLRIVPHANIAIALLTNGGDSNQLQSLLYRELFAELAGITMPITTLTPPAQPPTIDLTSFIGTYQRTGIKITVSQNNKTLHMLYEDQLKNFPISIAMDLVPVSETVFATTGFGEGWTPVIFVKQPENSIYCSIGMRATPKTA